MNAAQQIIMVGSALGGASAPAGFVPDVAPSAYRTTTQTWIAGLTQTGGVGVIPKLGAEFSRSIWWRHTSTAQGFVDNFHDQAATVGAVAIGGGSLQGMALYFSGTSIATGSLQNRFFLTGTDKAGNHISPSTVAVNTFGSAYGYITTETVLNNGNLAALLTTQYRNGNIELWITYRGMAPRLLIQQACTWTGTSSALPYRVGASLTSANSTGTMEFEMPTVIPDRSLSQNEIAQLADGVSPENLNAGSAKASASIKFALVTNGTTAAADRADGNTPVDGNTLTLNSAVYTFRTAPSLATELKTYADIAINQAFATDGTLTFASAPAVFPVNGQRVALHRTVMPSAIDPRYSYYVVNANSGANTYQLALTAGGTALPFTAGASSSAARLSFVPQMMDDLCTQLNALTPNAGGASNATYEAYGSDTLIITSRTAGGTSFTIDCNTTNVRFPTNKRLALAWAYITDYLNFNVGLLGDAGFIRRRSAAWPVPSGAELAPNTQVTGSMRINSWTDGMVTNSVGGTSYLALSGIYTGNAPASGGQVKFYDQNGATQVQDFTALTSFALDTTAKTWTGKLTAPAGKRWLACEQKKIGSTQVSHRSEVRFGFGKLIFAEGRSHSSDWFNDFATNDLAPNGFSSQFLGAGMTTDAQGFWTAADNCWHRYDAAGHVGAGAAAFSNKVSNDLGVNVGLISYSIGGVSFATLNTPTIWGYRQAASQQNWGDASLMPLADAFFWTHAQEEYGDTTTGLLPQLRANITTYLGAACKLGVTTSLTAGDSADGTMILTRVRGQQIDYKVARLAAGDTSVFDAGDYQYDRLNTADGVHSSGIIDHKVKCETAAIAYIGALSGVMNAGTGPTISSGVKSGVNIDISWNINGATALQVPNGAVDIHGLDVFLASSNGLPLIGNPTADSTTDTFTQAAHGWSNSDPVLITNNSGSQPAGISVGTKYFIVNAATNTYQLAATIGGAAINFTTNGASLYAYNTKALLPQTSHTITGANTTRITLAADPGASVMVMHLFGRPGRQNAGAFDPTPALDLTGRSAMTELWGPTSPAGAQGNFLNDNLARTYTSTTTIGRLARMTSSPITVS